MGLKTMAAARMRSGHAEGTPKASPSAPVHSRMGPEASHYAQKLTYSSEELKLLALQAKLKIKPAVKYKLKRLGLLNCEPAMSPSDLVPEKPLDNY